MRPPGLLAVAAALPAVSGISNTVFWASSGRGNATSAFVPFVHFEPSQNATILHGHQRGRQAPAWLRGGSALCVPFMFWAVSSDRAGWRTVFTVYTLASVAMNILNKEAVRDFRQPVLLVVIQMLASVFVVALVDGRNMKVGRWRDVARWSVVPVAFAGMLCTSMWAFEEATLSAIVVLKNVLPIISFGAEKALFDVPEQATPRMLLALLVVLGGTLMFGLADFSCTRLGKLLILANCVFTMLDRLAQAYFLKLSPDFSMSVPACMVANNVMGLLPVLLVGVARGEVKGWAATLAETSASSWLWVAASSFCGACLGYVGLKTQKLISGTSVLVLQNFNKMLIIIVSLAAYRDVLTSLPLAGCAISMLGCCLYGGSRLPGEAEAEKARK